MNTIANITAPSNYPGLSRELAPVQESSQLRDQQQRQPAPSSQPVVVENVKDRLQVRAVILSRESNPSGLSPRGREAVVAYRSLYSEEERDRISDLLGVDEYA